MDLFVKDSAFINTRIPFKNYKIPTRRNCGQNKDGTNMFGGNEHANAKRNNRTIVDSDYNSNNI